MSHNTFKNRYFRNHEFAPSILRVGKPFLLVQFKLLHICNRQNIQNFQLNSRYVCARKINKNLHRCFSIKKISMNPSRQESLQASLGNVRVPSCMTFSNENNCCIFLNHFKISSLFNFSS